MPLSTTSFILSLFATSYSPSYSLLPHTQSLHCNLEPSKSLFPPQNKQTNNLKEVMASTIVESRTLKLRLSSSKPLPPSPQSIDLSFKSCFRDSNINEENTNKTDSTFKPNMGASWSFLEALSDVSNKEPSQKETTYVHPQQKRSSLLLSPKSLELCTENLGNESGTDIADENDIDLLSSSNCSDGNSGTRQPRQPKKARTQNFPPPLTTIRGSESLLVRPHREDGRLVIEVTKVPPRTSCFQAERSNGRLRLCFLTNPAPSFDPEEEEEDEDVNVIDHNESPTLNEVFEEELCEQEMSGEIQQAEEKTEEETEKKTEEETGEETEDEEESFACGGCEKMKESDVKMEKYEWPRRCKEGGGDRENSELLLNWSEPFWVTT